MPRSGTPGEVFRRVAPSNEEGSVTPSVPRSDDRHTSECNTVYQCLHCRVEKAVKDDQSSLSVQDGYKVPSVNMFPYL